MKGTWSRLIDNDRAQLLVRRGLTPKRLEAAISVSHEAVKRLSDSLEVESGDISFLVKRWGLNDQFLKDAA